MPVPGITLRLFRMDQLADIADLNPDPCSGTSPARPSPSFLRALGHLLVLPFLSLLVAVWPAAATAR